MISHLVVAFLVSLVLGGSGGRKNPSGEILCRWRGVAVGEPTGGCLFLVLER